MEMTTGNLLAGIFAVLSITLAMLVGASLVLAYWWHRVRRDRHRKSVVSCVFGESAGCQSALFNARALLVAKHPGCVVEVSERRKFLFDPSRPPGTAGGYKEYASFDIIVIGPGTSHPVAKWSGHDLMEGLAEVIQRS